MSFQFPRAKPSNSAAWGKEMLRGSFYRSFPPAFLLHLILHILLLLILLFILFLLLFLLLPHSCPALLIPLHSCCIENNALLPREGREGILCHKGIFPPLSRTCLPLSIRKVVLSRCTSRCSC